MRTNKRALSPILIFVLFSLFLHFLGGTGVFLYEKYSAYQLKKSEPITINIVETTKHKELSETPPPSIEKVENAKQIVEQNVENDEEFNKTAKLLSAKNYHTKKQTIASNHGEFRNVKTNRKIGQEVNPSRSATAKQKNLTFPAEKQHQRTASVKDLHLPSLIPTLGVGDFRIRDAQKMVKETQPDAPTDQSPGGAAQGQGQEVSQSQDYLKNVDKGLETLLNTREFKYYSYYNRIRRQLSEHWEGIVRERVMRIYKEGRTIASSQDRITKLLVVLNSAGLLVNVQVLSDSGVQDLDEAAIDAFRSAAPFPNPPKGIVETDGTVRIRWDMVLET